MSKRMRQYVGIFAAVLAYYIVHEGAHLLTALYYGVFKGINFMGLGTMTLRLPISSVFRQHPLPGEKSQL